MPTLGLIVLPLAVAYVVSEVTGAKEALRSGRATAEYAKAIRSWIIAGAVFIAWWLGMVVMASWHVGLGAWSVYWSVGIGCFIMLLIAAQRMRAERLKGPDK
jgi:hypothetical protein